jgi:hypothetical protein
MGCHVYMVSCNFAIHAICLFTHMMYKYSELQMSSPTQKLSCKANCKTPFFFIVWVLTGFSIPIKVVQLLIFPTTSS